MYKYLVAFVLLTPLAGIWLVEGGEYAGSVGVDGFPNGATLAFALYAFGVAAVAFLSSRWPRQPEVSTPRKVQDTDALFRRFAANLLAFNAGFLVIFLFGFGAIDVWTGAVGKGEFRVKLGAFGALPNMMTKFIVPALLAYLAVLYSRTSRITPLRMQLTANLAMAFVIGASWGFKSTALFVLMPALLLLNWRIRVGTLIGLCLLFTTVLVVFFQIFDAGVEVDTDVQTFLLRRITVLQGDVAWHIWGLFEDGEVFPTYWPTLLAAFGDTALSMAGLSRVATYEWTGYHYDWMITSLAGATIDQIEEGHSITATPFAEGLVAGGLAGVALFALIGGLLVGRTYIHLDACLRRGHATRAAILSTYFCFYIFPWLNAGAIVQLFHVSLLVSIGSTLLVLKFMRRFRFGSHRRLAIA